MVKAKAKIETTANTKPENVITVCPQCGQKDIGNIGEICPNCKTENAVIRSLY